MNEWDLFIKQAKLTLNLLLNANLNPKLSAYAYMKSPFDFNTTPLAPLGAECLIHKKTSVWASWGY